MRIDDLLRAQLVRAVEKAGGAREFSQRCGIDAANISRYLRGRVHSITDRNWEKLLPFLDRADLPPRREAPGTVANTPELRNFIESAMAAKQLHGPEALRRLIGYDSPDTIRRLFTGKLNWFPDVLSAVFDALEIDRETAPISQSERELLSPAGMFSDGAMLVRPIPVVDWSNAASELEMMISDTPVMCRWDVENTETVPVPVGTRCDLRAFRVHGISMEPKIIDDDVLLVEPAGNIYEIPDNKIIVTKFSDPASGQSEVVCKRFHHQKGSAFLLTSDNPAGKVILLDPADVEWIGVVVRKISDL